MIIWKYFTTVTRDISVKRPLLMLSDAISTASLFYLVDKQASRNYEITN